MLNAILVALREILTNRKFALPVILGILMFLVENDIINVADAEVWAERIFQILGIILTGDIVFDLVNTIKGNTWNKQSKIWENSNS